MTAEPGLADLLSGAKSPDELRDVVRGLLMQRLSADPSLAPLLTLFDKQNAPTEPPPDGLPAEPAADMPVTDLPIAELLGRAVTEAAAEEARLRAENTRLRAKNDWSEARLAVLGAALGACPRCQGEPSESAGCTHCQGIAGAGFVVPEETLYAHWVQPAVERRATGSAHPAIMETEEGRS